MRILVIVLMLGLFLPVLSFGQNDLIVEPYSVNSMFLDDVIRGDTTAGGQRLNLSRVYVLRRGGLYFVRTTVQNTGYPMRVRAEFGSASRPEIHAFRSSSGAYPAQIFQVDTLIVLKSLSMVGWDEGGEAFSVYLSRLINVNRLGSDVYVDSCVLNGSTATLIQTSTATRYLRVTNSTFANGGNVRANNLGNGRAIDFRNVSIDSVLVENCSFINFNDRVWRHYGAGQVPMKNFTANHNTIVNELAEHGCIGIGKVDGTIKIINNLFVDHFAFGNDSTAYQGGTSSRLSEFGDTGERGPNGQFRMTFVGTSPDTNTTTTYVIRNNYWSVSDSLQAFYVSRNDSADAGVGNFIPLTWNINGKLGADSILAFHEVTTPIVFTKAPPPPLAMVRWFFRPLADSGSSKLKQNATFKPEYDFDRRTTAYFADSLDLAYPTSSLAYVGASGGQPVGDLRWWNMTPITDVESPGGSVIPEAFSLEQNYPNPFNPTTAIRFELPQSGNVVLKVFNLLGQEVVTLINARMNAGKHVVPFDASRLTSGVYFYTLSSGNFNSTKKMTLVK